MLFTAADLIRSGGPTGINVRYLEYEVTGLFATEMYLYDNTFVAMQLSDAQYVAGLGDAVSGVQIRVHDPWRAQQIGDRIADSLGGYPIYAESWMKQNAQLFGALKLEKLGMGLIIAFITVVAAFSIIGTLTMIVGEKTREIGILRARGLPRASIGRVFLAQGATIGVVGTAAGVLLGLALGWVLDESRLITIDPQIYFVDHLPVHFQPLDLLVVIGTSLTIALGATLPTSRWAAQLQPVDAIRHE
jgi:lipoprotein-releasing system permease protein